MDGPDSSSMTPPPSVPSSLAPGPGPLTPLPSPPHPSAESHTATPSTLSVSRTADFDLELTTAGKDSPESSGAGGAAGHDSPLATFVEDADSDEAMDDVSDEADDAASSGSGIRSWFSAVGTSAAPTSGIPSSAGGWGLPARPGGGAGGRRPNKGDRGGSSGAKAYALGPDGERQEANKVLDKDYKGKFDFDPFLEQLTAERSPTATATA